MKFVITTILTGKIAPFKADEATSAIHKLPVSGQVRIGPLGLEGDEQADQVNHGGVDKAIHHYPADHYPYWQGRLGDLPLLHGPGAFGENISTFGVTETDVCLGDRLRLGTSLVEVSQGRQPCWKLDHRFATKGVLADVVESGRAGWYYRVLEPGMVQAGDALSIVERRYPDWPVARVFALLIGGQAKASPSALHDLQRVPVLAQSWKRRLEKLLG
ncbi:MAG: MOSC domain-containing protein [Pseudomonadota bacterium]